MGTNSKQKKVIQLVIEYVKNGGRVLEVSCGDGKVLDQLQKAGYVVPGQIIQNILVPFRQRVVKMGGHVIILTPNTIKINFLLTCFFKIKRAFIGFDVPADMAFVFHNNPPHLPVFLYHLHSYYLEKVYGANYKFKSIIFWLLFAPMIVPYTFFNGKKSEV